MRRFAFWILQWTWGLPQNLIGLLLLLLLGRQRRERYHGAVITRFAGHQKLAQKGCVSLGMFIFMSDQLEPSRAAKIRVHEYGHCIQSLIFGPVFLLAVGLPSLVWAACYSQVHQDRNIAYTSRYPENNANKLGHRITGEIPMEW